MILLGVFSGDEEKVEKSLDGNEWVDGKISLPQTLKWMKIH